MSSYTTLNWFKTELFITLTFTVWSKPSIWLRSSRSIRCTSLSAKADDIIIISNHWNEHQPPVCASNLLVAMASISSMKMMAGAFSFASLKTSRTILGPSPRYFWTNSEPTTRIKEAKETKQELVHRINCNYLVTYLWYGEPQLWQAWSSHILEAQTLEHLEEDRCQFACTARSESVAVQLLHASPVFVYPFHLQHNNNTANNNTANIIYMMIMKEWILYDTHGILVLVSKDWFTHNACALQGAFTWTHTR